MAKKILTSYDFTKNEIQNAVIQVLASAPSSPVQGQFYYDSSVSRPMFRTSSAWLDLTARANHSGTQTASTISDFSTASDARIAAAVGVSVQAFDADLSAIAALSATAGMVSRTGAGAFAVRTLSSGTTALTIADPTGAAGNPTISVANVVAAGASGLMTGSDKTKLDGVATGATANSSDAVLLARSNHTGTQTASTISDFDTQVRTSRLDQMASPTASVSLNSQKITNLADPTNPQDSATKNYVDNARAGLSVKDPVRVVAQGNVTLSAPGAAIDGVTLSANDRFLAPLQSTTTQIGIYVFNGSATPATRAPDADATGEIFDGSLVAVSEGTDAGKQYIQTATPSGAPGAWSQNWTVYTTGGTSYIAGSGLVLSSTTFNVGAGTGITVNADDVAIDTSVVVRKFAASIGDGTTTAIVVTHSLGTKDITCSVRQVSDDAFVECDVNATSTTTATFTFSVAPTTNQYRVTIHG